MTNIEEHDMTAVRLPEEVEIRLDELARKTGRTKSFYIRNAVMEYLQDMEDLYLGNQELEKMRAGKSKLTPIEDLLAEFGIRSRS